jgi:co-chaperonin GroES (HSP10)
VAFKPYFGRVLIKAETFLDKVGQLKALKAAGFQLPDTVKERDLPQWGKVVAVGSTADASIAIGTRVLFGKYAGHKLEGSEDLYVVQDADIIGADVGECEPEGMKCEVTGVPVKGPFATLSDLYNDRTEGAA